MNKEEEQAKRLAKLQSTLESVQMPRADQNLVVYHRERRPLAEEELVHASPSGLVGAAKKSPAPKRSLGYGRTDPQPVEDLEEVGENRKSATGRYEAAVDVERDVRRQDHLGANLWAYPAQS